ncbi:MAG: NF038122 family metalloprotease [Gammaproteobacteria bacterium]|nr:NF038122 family metalloprotease [Gammaproteobacteria bacterium]
MKTTKRSGTPVAVLFAVCGLCVATGPAQALTIVPTFGSSVSASQQAAIDNAIGFYQQSFTDPISVNIDFSVASGVTYAGKSESTFGVYSYRAYSNALASDAATNGNSIEQTAYNNLPYGNTAGYIAATSSNLRALGCATCAGQLTASGTSGGSFDGTISINSSDFGMSVIQHEIDEVLGIGGSGSVLNTVPTHGQSYIQPLDLFRYAGAHTPSFTTSGTATSYFSIDGGVTNIVDFNQNSKGDYGDWASSPCHVQSWQLCSNSQSISLSSPEGIALQAIGYDAVTPVPLPGSLILLTSGLIGIGMIRRHGVPAPSA